MLSTKYLKKSYCGYMSIKDEIEDDVSKVCTVLRNKNTEPII